MQFRSLAVSWLLLALPLAAVPLLAQDAKTGSAPAALPRVHVIGASLSGGFKDGPLTGASEPGDSVTLQHVLKAWCGEHARATTHPPIEMLAMFTDPEKIGDKQVQAAKRAAPAVVVAIDFPFWFAYGYFRGGDPDTQRTERYQRGLELLASLGVPVLVGDLPDMHGAAVRLLAPAQIPNVELLRALNDKLRAFVAEHRELRLVPIAELVATMKERGVSLPLAGGALQTPPGALLQGDRLHPNRLGMAYLGLQLQPALQALFPDGHPLRTQTWAFDEFVSACGAEQELDALRKPAKAGAAADPAGK